MLVYILQFICAVKMKVAVVVCLIVYIGAACALKLSPPGSCPSEIVGPTCTQYKLCKPGYECRQGKCCAACPKGKLFGGQCNFNPGEQKCQFGYDCIYGLCCATRPVGPIRKCPKQIKGLVLVCPPFDSPIPECTSDKSCGKGLLCCRGPCGRKYCTKGVIVPRRG